MAKIKISDTDRQAAGDIELRSEQIREILGQVPRWVVRYGTVFIFLILVILIAVSALLKYPDVITARVILTTETPPAQLVAKKSARIQKFLVTDKEYVEEGEVVAVLESAADYRDILQLQSLLGDNYQGDSLMQASYPLKLALGPVQESYAGFQKRLQEYSGFLNLDYYNRKIQSINLELKKYSRFLDRLKDQEQVLKKDYELAEKQYARDSSLFADQVISASQLEKSETQKLSKLYELKDNQTQLASAEIDVSNLQQEILELELKLEENSRDHRQRLQEAWENLKGDLAVWEEQYILRSPFEGQVSFSSIWSENQYVEEGDIVLTILPAVQGEIIGKALLDALGAGKVREGHKVVIRFDNYPYMEFGTVSGKVSSLSLLPVEEVYAVEIRMDSSLLLTNYGKLLDFRQNMSGLAEIITEQRTLLQRILDPFRSAVGRQKTLNE